MSTTLVLGPSRWTRARGRVGPTRRQSWVREDPSRARRRSPLGLRRDLVRELRRHGIRALVFEDWPREPNEAHSHAFARLIDIVRVDVFAVLWPRHAKMFGVDWEFGFLAGRVASGALDPRRILLLLESGVVRRHLESGTISVGEPGNRTRYFQDLVTWRCPISTWSGYDTMLRTGVRGVLEVLDG